MVSTPSYNPNTLRSPSAYERLAKDTQARPLVNRAVQFGYAPGSTFKIVTATAAIDTGQFTPAVDAQRAQRPAGLRGAAGETTTTKASARSRLTEALAKSVNTVWAQVAEKLGKRTMARYMNRFGFDRKPELDYPADEMSASGEYLEGERILPAHEPARRCRPHGNRSGQTAVTPLQMAEVAAAVANHGRLMAPHLTERIVDPEGRTVEQISPRVQSVVMKPSTAAAVDRHDGSGRKRRHRHAGADPRGAGGGQDRHRRDAGRYSDQQRLVHRVRARRPTRAWRSP